MSEKKREKSVSIIARLYKKRRICPKLMDIFYSDIHTFFIMTCEHL